MNSRQQVQLKYLKVFNKNGERLFEGIPRHFQDTYFQFIGDKLPQEQILEWATKHGHTVQFMWEPQPTPESK